MRDVGQRLEVGDVEPGVADGLDEQQPGAVVDGRADLIEVVDVDELGRDAPLGQRVLEQVVRAAIQRLGGDQVVPRARQIENGERLAAWPLASASAATPPSSSAIRFSNTSLVGFMIRV